MRIVHKNSNKDRKIVKYINLIRETEDILNRYGYTSDVFKKNADELLEKLNNRQLVVSVIGQFKRGKSSLINALLRDEILPVSVLPLTSVAVYIMYSNKLSLEIMTEKQKNTYNNYFEIKEKIFQYATEEANPENKKGVKKVLLYYPNPFLKQNIILVDTPGIGSIYNHNTKTAEEVIPKSDIGIFVVSPDPPFTEVELNYFKVVLPKINTSFFVINKADIVSKDDLKKVEDFYKNVINSIVKNQNKKFVFSVSAKKAIARDETRNSGIYKLRETILSYLEKKRMDILIDISSARLKNLFIIIQNEILLIINTLKMDFKKFEENILLFNEKLNEIEDKADIINGQLNIYKDKIISDLDKDFYEIKKEVKESFFRLFLDVVKNGEIIEEKVYKVIEQIEKFFEKKYRIFENKIEEKVITRLNELKHNFEEPLKKLKETMSDFFKIKINIPDEAVKFEFVRSPYWIDKNTSFSYKLLKDNFFLKLMPRMLRQHILTNKIKEDFNSIIVRNIENIRWSLIQNAQNTFIKYDSFYNDKYNQVKRSIFEAIDKVKEAKTDFKESKGIKIKTLNALLKKISLQIKRIEKNKVLLILK